MLLRFAHHPDCTICVPIPGCRLQTSEGYLPLLLLVYRNLSKAYGLAVDGRGGISGGTLASGFNQAEVEDPAELAQLQHDKYFLLPKEAK